MKNSSNRFVSSRLPQATMVVTLVAALWWWSDREPLASATLVPPTGGAAAINKAIKQCAEKGGKVQLGAGLFLCNEPIIMDASRVSLQGAGPSTILKLENLANCPVIVIGDPGQEPQRTVNNIRVSDLAIDGNREQQGEECWSGECDTGGKTSLRRGGIVIRKAEDVQVENVSISRCRSGGLVTEKGCNRLTIRQLDSSDHEFDGLACYETKHSIFTQLYLHGNKAAGVSIDLNFEDNLLTNAFLTGNGTHGIFMRASRNNSFQGMVVRDSGRDGIYMDQADGKANTAATGNSFIGLHIARSGGHAIRINNASCRNNLIDGTQFSDNKGGLFEATPGLAKFEAAFGR